MSKINKPLPKDTEDVLLLIKRRYKKHMMYGTYYYGGYNYADVDIVLFNEHQEEVRQFLGENNIEVADGCPGSVGSIHTRNTVPVNIICLPAEAYASCRIARDFMQLVEPITDKGKRYGAFLSVLGLCKASGLVPASGSFDIEFGTHVAPAYQGESTEKPF